MAFRSLAEALRARTDEELARLLQARPDLASPAPEDVTELARRAGASASVRRALSRLDRPTLTVAHAAAVITAPFTVAQLAAGCAADPEDLAGPLEELHRLALVWGEEESLRPVRALPQVLGPHPAGLGPPAGDIGMTTMPRRLAAACTLLGATPTGDPTRDLTAWAARVRQGWSTLIDDAPPGAGDLLHRFDTDGPIGPAGRPGDEHPDALRWVLDRLLLVPVQNGLAIMPREVGLALRGHVMPLPQPPARPGALLDPAAVARLAAAAAVELIRWVERLAQALDDHPPPRLRLGGIGVRESARLARDLGLEPARTALVLETAAAAGLIGVDEAADPVHRPTDDFDAWAGQPLAERWLRLAQGWLQEAGSAQLAGTRDERGQLRAPLSAATRRGTELRLRSQILDVLADAAPGTGFTRPVLEEHLRWLSPLGPVSEPGLSVTEVLAEAQLLGLVAQGCASAAARAVRTDPAQAVQEMAAAMPQAADHVIIQTDLTAVAPGPISSGARALLDAIAEVDSHGAATVYRFTARSIRRGLDAGLDSTTLLTELENLSATGLPQPLEYLIRDEARRHGQIRVGTASCYLRHDDEVRLTEMLFDPALAGLGLSRIAPTVLISSVDPVPTLAALRRAGYAPAAEHPDGRVVVPHSRPARAPVPDRPVVSSTVELQECRALVRALRRPGGGEPDEQSVPPHRIPTADPAVTLTTIEAAIREGARLWVAGTDALGARTVRLIEPLTREPGRIRVLDARGRVDVIPLHRISGVLPHRGVQGADPGP